MSESIKKQGDKEGSPSTPCYLLVLFGKYKTTDSEYTSMQDLGTEKAEVKYIPPIYTGLEDLKTELKELTNKKISGISGHSDHWLGAIAQKHLETTLRDYGYPLYLHGLKFVFRGSEVTSENEWIKEEQQDNKDFLDSKVDASHTCLHKEQNQQICFEKLVTEGNRLKAEGKLDNAEKWDKKKIDQMDQSSVKTTAISNTSNNGIIIGSVSGSVAGLTLLSILSVVLKHKFF